MRAAAAASSSSPIRCRPPVRNMSDTASTQAVATPSRPPSVNSVAASISTATAPRLRQASARGPRWARVVRRAVPFVEEIGRHDRRRGHCSASPPTSAGCQVRIRPRRSRRPPAPGSCRPRPAPRRRRSARRVRGPGSSAPQVPTRIARRTPSSASSWRTIAALGPPMPVDWMLSGRPLGVSPVYPQSPRAWLLILGSVSSCWASARARPGSPGSRASSRVRRCWDGGGGAWRRARYRGVSGRCGSGDRLSRGWSHDGVQGKSGSDTVDLRSRVRCRTRS